jgi:hypothetical protein
MNTPIDPATPIAVTLQAQEWNQLIALVSETPAPYRVTAPLIQKLGGQISPAPRQSSRCRT